MRLSPKSFGSLLPHEVVLRVLQYCSSTDLNSLSECSDEWFEFSRDNSIWLERCYPKWGRRFLSTSQEEDFHMTFFISAESHPTQLQFFPLEDVTFISSKSKIKKRSADKKKKGHMNNEEHNLRLEVQYHGVPGQGNRSVRGDFPFPYPSSRRASSLLNSSCKTRGELNSDLAEEEAAASSNSQWDFVSWALKISGCCKKMEDPQPFAFPFQFVCEEGTIKTYFGPRMVVYFEIEIGGKQADSTSDARQEGEECIAIGVGTALFRHATRLPGWDEHSYGYHGDDGGLFAGSGTKRATYGPRFGPGDVVGCGLDYLGGPAGPAPAGGLPPGSGGGGGGGPELFFTFNGARLPPTGVRVRPGRYYPVVGVDARSPVALNFGARRPFAYPLAAHARAQAPAARARLPPAPAPPCRRRRRRRSLGGPLGGEGAAAAAAAAPCRRRGSSSASASSWGGGGGGGGKRAARPKHSLRLMPELGC